MAQQDQLISIGQIDSSDTLGTTLHHSAIHGNKKALKKVLDKGIHVDYPNDEGQSPLFIACLEGKESIVEYLISSGANPNEKSNSGLTPVHAACYSGHVKILMKLLNGNGDLRLHDNHGRSVKDWAILQPVPKKRMKMLEFLDKTRLFAMSGSGHDLLMKKASTKTLHNAHHRRNTVTKIIRDKIGRPSVHENLEKMASSHHSVGFGQVYSNGSDTMGFISAIPLVSENHLRHDTEGETYNNGAFAVMESMWWEYTEVTVKRLHRDLDPYQGGVVDLLINEIEHIGKLRHPHVLTLMGVCQTSNLDGLILIYERISEGSLYTFLHQKMERLPSATIHDIALQMCSAIVFIHLRGLIHCAITSHAISVVNQHTFKLGNFEYMIETSKCEWGKKNSVSNNTNENAVCNWLAPEVMFNMPPSYYCDMYSYCAVLWEIFHGDIPWDSQCSDTIKSQYQKGVMLNISHGKMADFYKVILDYGLQLDPTNRKLSFLHVRDLLLASPKDAKYYMMTHFKHLQSSESKKLASSVGSPPTPTAPTVHNGVGRTSRDIDDSLAEKSKRKERERESERDYQTKLASAMEAERRLEKKEQERRERRDDYNKKTRNAREQHIPQKPARQLNYQTNGIRWESVQESTGGEYHYTVSASPDKKVCINSREEMAIKPGYCTPFKSVPDESSTSVDNVTSTDKTDSSTDIPTRRQLERKTSSMGRFSYLNLESRQKTRSAAAKPACHGHYELVADEYSTSGKLTTAGSLYALYNDHSPNLPMGQLPHHEDDADRTPTRATLPKTNREAASSRVEVDPQWFGGQGSVRNLAKLFQQHIQKHGIFQSVIDGTINQNHMKMLKRSEDKRTPDYGNHADSQMQDSQGFEERQGSDCSLTSVSMMELGDQIQKSAPDNSYQIVFDCDNESTSTCTSNMTVDSASESDMVSKWVDHELRKIKRNLSKEVMKKQSQNMAFSPDLFDRSDNHEESVTRARDDQNWAHLDTAVYQTGDHDKYATEEEAYYDDEIYSNGPKLYQSTYRDMEEAPPSPSTSSLPMDTVLKKTTVFQDELSNETCTKRQTSNKKRTSKIPTSRSSLSTSKSKVSDGAYANIVTVRSSLDDAGVHQVTHKMKNLKTGGSHTIMNDTVNARKVVTTFRAAQ